MPGPPTQGPADDAPGGSVDGGGPTRILVVDDHRTFAELLSLALEAEPDLTCVGHAQRADEAVTLARQLRPDVVIMDVQLPDVDGLEVTRRLVLELPDLRVIVLTAHGSPDTVLRAAAAGACAFLPKDGALTQMLHTVRTAHHGALVIRPDSLLALAGQRAEACTELTPREHDVLGLLGTGLDPRGIARQLGISVNTSRGHVKSLLAKLGAHSQLEAVVIAQRRGLLPVDGRVGAGS